MSGLFEWHGSRAAGRPALKLGLLLDHVFFFKE